MSKKKQIIEGYQPTDKLDTSNPPNDKTKELYNYIIIENDWREIEKAIKEFTKQDRKQLKDKIIGKVGDIGCMNTGEDELLNLAIQIIKDCFEDDKCE